MIIQLVIVLISVEGLSTGKIRGRSTDVNRIKTTFKKHGVVPDVIDDAPSQIIQVRYGRGAVVELGNELTPLSVKDKPTSVEWPIEEGQYYTLFMLDLDAPCRRKPLFGPSKHWLVMNIPGTDLTKGKTLSEYVGARPPESTGLHRYVFLVYKQPGLLKHSERYVGADSRKGRLRFNLKKFTKKYNLGQPIAANLYQAKFDDYVKEHQSKNANTVSKNYVTIQYNPHFEKKYKKTWTPRDILDCCF